jgi:hypothetical protein
MPDKIIITSLPEKLPEEVRALIDEQRPLPADVPFFEERFTLASIAGTTVMGIVVIVLGVVLSLIGVLAALGKAFLLGLIVPFPVPLLAGVVCLFGGYLLVSSLGGRTKLGREQAAGAVTRYGIFLLGDLLICRSFFDTTVIPRPFFKGLEGRAVHYELDGAAKSFNLPAAIVGRDVRDMDAAIAEWAKRG